MRPSVKTHQSPGEKLWRALFVAGLVVGNLFAFGFNSSFPTPLSLPASTYALSGILVAVGTRVGNGCTSGHGLCGLARFSSRSLVAVCSFMGSGMLVASFGGGLWGVDDDANAPTNNDGWRVAPVSWPPQMAFPLAACLGGCAFLGLAVLLASQAQASNKEGPTLQRALALVHLAQGILFGLGLAVAGMTSQTKVTVAQGGNGKTSRGNLLLHGDC